MEEVGRNESIRVAIDDDGAVVAEGDIDLAGGPLLEAAIARCEASAGPVVIDLGGVEFIDSSGLRWVNIERPSPLAFPLLVDHMREKLSSEKLADRVRKMQARLESAAAASEKPARKPRRKKAAA